MSRSAQPLVYACSGCSNVAQLANSLALRLDRQGLAEMSCIAGVGGRVPALVRTAQSGRPIIALDGCRLHCSKACLHQVDVQPDLHVTLSDFGLRKRFGEDCSDQDIEALDKQIRALWQQHLEQTCGIDSP
ncbi:MAG: zinc-binding protein [Gammaproteobacteria bacterium HGW-Gammaproteobacteria-11]|nr:MAG: zinc-binding protein [Gammaproteobacteria bacterium HGW-Gammaproteobacteria-11]